VCVKLQMPSQNADGNLSTPSHGTASRKRIKGSTSIWEGQQTEHLAHNYNPLKGNKRVTAQPFALVLFCPQKGSVLHAQHDWMLQWPHCPHLDCQPRTIIAVSTECCDYDSMLSTRDGSQRLTSRLVGLTSLLWNCFDNFGNWVWIRRSNV